MHAPDALIQMRCGWGYGGVTTFCYCIVFKITRKIMHDKSVVERGFNIFYQSHATPAQFN